MALCKFEKHIKHQQQQHKIESDSRWHAIANQGWGPYKCISKSLNIFGRIRSSGFEDSITDRQTDGETGGWTEAITISPVLF